MSPGHLLRFRQSGHRQETQNGEAYEVGCSSFGSPGEGELNRSRKRVEGRGKEQERDWRYNGK